MDHKTIHEIGSSLGLTIDAVPIPENENAFRVFKGARQIFIGSEEAVREFFIEYEKGRPALLEGSMYGYRE